MRAAEGALTSEQRATLQSWAMAGKTEQRLVFRAQIILALDEGLGGAAAASPTSMTQSLGLLKQ